MKYTLHKLPEGFIITSDETLRGSDLIIWTGETVEHFPKQGIPQIRHGCIVESVNYSGTLHEKWKKVIAQQDQIEFSFLTEEEQKKIGWFDVTPLVNKHFEKYWDKENGTKMTKDEITAEMMTSLLVEQASYVAGFQKAQELLSDRMFTSEEVKTAMHLFHDREFKTMNDVIQFLSQSKSWKVEIEMEEYVQEETGTELKWVGLRPKFIDGKVKIIKIR